MKIVRLVGPLCELKFEKKKVLTAYIQISKTDKPIILLSGKIRRRSLTGSSRKVDY